MAWLRGPIVLFVVLGVLAMSLQVWMGAIKGFIRILLQLTGTL